MNFLAEKKLPDDYRDSIGILFKMHRLNNVAPFLDAIDKWLPEYKEKKDPTGAQFIRRKLDALQESLAEVNKDTETKDLLIYFYRAKYPSSCISQEDAAGKKVGNYSPPSA